MHVNGQRLIADLRTLASIGQYQTGVDRTAFSTQDIQAREWLRDRMREAGLEAMIDNAGNVYGRTPGVKRAILIGSHTDTVPRGGWLDGSLGVIYGLEIARCRLENGAARETGVDVVSFQDEEGTYLALFGSRSFCGEQDAASAAAARNRDGALLTDALGLAGIDNNPPARLDPSRHVAFLEAHIEQGPRLEATGLRIGIVTAIVGIRSFRILFSGRADHAGTTPMDMRSDAGAAAADFSVAIAEAFRQIRGPHSVWNIGASTYRPGAVNVVPAEAELAFQFRDDAADRMAQMEQLVREVSSAAAGRHGAQCTLTPTLATDPTPMDPELTTAIESAARRLQAPHMSLPSGAGHDALVLARHIPSAMLFVPSIGGRSHHISEDTSEEDIILGANVLLGVAEERVSAKS